MNNTWLSAYKKNIDGIIYQLNEYHMKGSYGGNLNFPSIIKLLSGACTEIEKLQNSLNIANEENMKLRGDKELLNKKLDDLLERIKRIEDENSI